MSAFSMHFARPRQPRAADVSKRVASGSTRRSAAVALAALMLAQGLIAPAAFAQTVSDPVNPAQAMAVPGHAAPATALPPGHPVLPSASALSAAASAQPSNAAPVIAPPATQTTTGAPATGASMASDSAAGAPVAAGAARAATPAPVAGAIPHDLSPWGMFMQADMVVKAVMLGLAFASLVTWTIWLAKTLELLAARQRAVRALRRLRAADSLVEAQHDLAIRAGGPVSEIVAAAAAEEDRSSGLPAEGVKERVAIALSRIESGAGRHMARGTGLLATIGSTAPFVGLFGTVWGIMNSFIGISVSKTTNLAVVAPGIAEALLATALGLVAAIPAVIIYNVFSRSITGYRALLSDASALALQHLSRDLDRRDAGIAAGAGPLRKAAE